MKWRNAISLKNKPYTTAFFTWLVTGAVFFEILFLQGLYWPFALLAALNGSTFVLYGFDKMLAMLRARRIPERILWWAAFAGGPVGAILGMIVFRHKVSKKSFQFILAVALLAEIAIAILLFERFGPTSLAMPDPLL